MVLGTLAAGAVSFVSIVFCAFGTSLVALFDEAATAAFGRLSVNLALVVAACSGAGVLLYSSGRPRVAAVVGLGPFILAVVFLLFLAVESWL